MNYQIEMSDIRKMNRLMKRLTNKAFTADDNKELATLSARFLFTSKAIDYLDGYTITNP